MNAIKSLTCIICPLGCSLNIELNSNEIQSITGATCKRGEKYVETEFKNPVRTLTTTVRLLNGTSKLIPVKSENPIPKGMILDCMNVINSTQITSPVNIGDIVVSNILNTGINIVSTKNAS